MTTPSSAQLEKLRVAVADLCGWIRITERERKGKTGGGVWGISRAYQHYETTISGYRASFSKLPNYSTSLEAMHSAVSAVITTDELKEQYMDRIWIVVGNDLKASSHKDVLIEQMWDAFTPSAWQRAVALIRTFHPDYKL